MAWWSATLALGLKIVGSNSAFANITLH
jgi:hypothetical protein